MGSNYVSAGEAEYREQRRQSNIDKDNYILQANRALVGEPKTYKGISYQMKADGQFTCLGLPPLSGLDGTFNSTNILHSIIDDLERVGKLPLPKG